MSIMLNRKSDLMDEIGRLRAERDDWNRKAEEAQAQVLLWQKLGADTPELSPALLECLRDEIKALVPDDEERLIKIRAAVCHFTALALKSESECDEWKRKAEEASDALNFEIKERDRIIARLMRFAGEPEQGGSTYHYAEHAALKGEHLERELAEARQLARLFMELVKPYGLDDAGANSEFDQFVEARERLAKLRNSATGA